MRNDLTAAFLAEMVKDENEPIILMVVHFFSVGDIFLSDRDMNVHGQFYEGLVESWGELSTVGAENAISSTKTMNVTLWNGAGTDIPFSEIFATEDPTDVFVEVFQTYAGLDPEDMVHIDEFIIQDPIKYDEVSSLVTIDLVTTNMRYFAQVGELLTRRKFPYALESDLNKSIDLIVGNAGTVQTICSKKPPTAFLDRSVVRTTVNIEVAENLTELNFPLHGSIWINAEKVTYGSRSDFAFHGVLRGQDGTRVSEHGSGSAVILADATVEYIVGKYPLVSVSNVKIGDKPAQQPYSVVQDAVNNVVKLVFDSQPVFELLEPAKDATVFFDTTIHDPNQAEFPHYSWDNNNKEKGAEISRAHSVLSIANLQDSITENAAGEIVNVFLNVTSWSTLAYIHELVNVLVESEEGSGVYDIIGSLTRPNAAAALELVADVDIDHPHTHETGGQHTHTSYDPTVTHFDTLATHPTYAGVNKTLTATPEENGYRDGLSTVNSLRFYDVGYFQFPAIDGGFVEDITFTVDYSLTGDNVYLGYVSTIIQYFEDGVWKNSGRPAVDIQISQPGNTGSITFPYGSYRSSYLTGPTYRIKIYLEGHNSVNGIAAEWNIRESNARMTYTIVQETTTGAFSDNTIARTAAGSVVNMQQATSVIKNDEDVNDLIDDNRVVNVDLNDTTLYTQSFIDRFDLLDYKSDMTWEWLQGKRIKLQMVSASGSVVHVHVTWVDITVEYRQPKYEVTDLITCDVVGSVDNRPDMVIQHLLHDIAKVPLDKFGSVWREFEYWNDTKIWNDTDTWIDGGIMGDVPTGAFFEEAASWFVGHNYKIDGVIPGNTPVKDACQNVTWQARSRLLWQSNSVQLVIKRKSENWLIANEIDIDDIQFRSYSAKRSRVDQIQNNIDLFYMIDRLSLATGPEMYGESVNERDQPSIDKHGERKNDNMWLFDLVRDTGVAESVASYYKWELGETSTYYTFDTFLTKFNIEKDDYVKINSFRFDRLVGVPAVIRECIRRFGSGKNNQINTLQMVAHVIRRVVLLLTIEDKVSVSDTLAIDFGSTLSFDDVVHIVDVLLFETAWEVLENITVNDTFGIIANYKPTFEDVVATADSLGFDISMEIVDTVSVTESLDLLDEPCFGACGFGTLPFGSPTEHNIAEPDVSTVKDILSMLWERLHEDNVTVTDTLIASDGFGCPSIGDGLGITPFGDEYCE